MKRLSYNQVQSVASIVSRYYQDTHPEWKAWRDKAGNEYRDGVAIYLEKYYSCYAVCLITSGTTGHENLCIGSLRECYAYLNAMRDYYNNQW